MEPLCDQHIIFTSPGTCDNDESKVFCRRYFFIVIEHHIRVESCCVSILILSLSLSGTSAATSKAHAIYSVGGVYIFSYSFLSLIVFFFCHQNRPQEITRIVIYQNCATPLAHIPQGCMRSTRHKTNQT